MCLFHQEAIRKFVSELKDQGVFAREVHTAGVAFHSYFMASIAPNLLAALKKVSCTIPCGMFGILFFMSYYLYLIDQQL